MILKATCPHLHTTANKICEKHVDKTIFNQFGISRQASYNPPAQGKAKQEKKTKTVEDESTSKSHFS